jgi:ectoine hydroxylase-related dioxygenase (phytanoyl-CoA dioxygenase family)
VLTHEQEAHFRLFGFLVLRGAFDPSEMAAISQDFDEVLSEARAGLPFGGAERQIVMGFIEKRPSLIAIVEDDRIYEAVQQLLSGTPVWIGSDGNLYVGDTYWHPDARAYQPLGIKVALYLDPVGQESGCLRVIPGSHMAVFSVPLESAPLRGPEGGRTVGLKPRDVPAYALDSQPGDVVFFDHRTWHASFGGTTGRRMFTMNFAAPLTSGQQRDRLVELHRANSQTSPTGEVYSDAFLSSDSPRIQAMTSVLHELGLR